MKIFHTAITWPIIITGGALLSACSGGGGGGGGGGNTTAVQTCYDVRVSYGANNQTRNICTTKENGGYNGLGVNRFLRFSLPGSATVTVSATRTSGLNPADPDLILYEQGNVRNFAESITANSESMITNLSAGDYVVELTEYHYQSASDKLSYFKSPVEIQQSKLIEFPEVQAPSSCTINSGSDPVVSGVVEFERVPHVGGFNNSLDYSNIMQLPVQEAIVEVFCNDGVIADPAYSDVTTASGNYSVKVPANQLSFVRVRAQMFQTGNPSWNISVVDNTSGKATYVLVSSSLDTNVNETRNMTAISGWTGSNYGGTRAAAPFAILDSVRKAKDEVLAADPTANFPGLLLNWSENNTTASGNLNTGLIGTSFYQNGEIYLLGAENNDTDEYDEHVIVHEWGHYFEDKFSRSDSIGGPHSGGEILDIRVAFSEGFGNAFSGIVMGDPVYRDASGFQQGVGFSINVESNNCSNPGWFSECSVQSILYDIADANDDGESLNLGFSPIYDVFVNQQQSSAALTSLFSFMKPFKDANGNAVDALTGAQNIDPILDIYGDSEISNNPGNTDQLPVYLQY